MAIVSTKGLVIKMTKDTHTNISLTPTAVSSAAPAVITVADTTGMTNGDLVQFANTGFSELDLRVFVVGSLTATTFTAVGSDTSGTTGSLAASPEATVWKKSDMVNLCLSEIAIDAAEPATIDISTFCNPGASLPGNPTPGSVTLTGFVDIADTGYSELLAAETDGEARAMDIEIPNNGNLVGLIVIGSLTFDLPIEGAAGFSGSASMSIALKHRF